MTTLIGKVALITGSAPVIGRAIAKRNGRSSARVIVNCSRHEAIANEVVDLIQRSGARAVAIPRLPLRLRGGRARRGF
jgi:NAD(P)-dependent dehydrogenase (short-subunit alcohol dehydrogenase family)